MMDEQLDDVARRGEPIAALTASEASIYERFGYGTATFTTGWELESEYARLERGAGADGAVRLVDGAAAAAAAQAVYERIAPARVGELGRPAEWWPSLFTPGSRGPRFFTAVHDGPDGQPGRLRRATCSTRTGPTAYPARRYGCSSSRPPTPTPRPRCGPICSASTWSATVVAVDRPVDDPLRWRLPDARRLRVRQLRDHLWVRVARRRRGTRRAHLRHRRRPRARAGRRLPSREQRTLAGRGRPARSDVHCAPTAPPTSRSEPPTSARSSSAGSRCRRWPPPGGSGS